jgi:hypothetical protein
MADYYEGEEMAEAPAAEGEMPAEEGAKDDNSFLAPKYAFPGGCKPGDKYTVEVKSVMEDELELVHVGEKKEGEPEAEGMDETEAGLLALEAK